MAYDNGTFDWHCVHVYRYFVVKLQRSTHNPPLYIIYIRRPMRHLRICSQFRNFNVVNNGSGGDLGRTPRIILTVLFCKMNRGSKYVYTQIPKLYYNMKCKDM